MTVITEVSQMYLPHWLILFITVNKVILCYDKLHMSLFYILNENASFHYFLF